jgi:CRISPR/Cas system CSM-associated protein Csm3 (group 7 of RAMP superfamily)
MSERDCGLHPFRYRIEGVLKVLSPLHVGTGDMESDLIDRREDDKEAPGLATLVRDAGGLPFIPGSSMKGLLRRLAGSKEEADALFGAIRASEKRGNQIVVRGHISPVFVWGAQQKTAGAVGGAPYAAELRSRNRDGSFVAARTGIDGATGTADHNRLFFQECVPAGAEFALRLLVVGDDEGRARKTLERLKPVLNRLAAGAAMGKGQSDGQGRVKLLKSGFKVTRQWIGADGELQEAEEKIDLAKETAASATVAGRWTVTLHCPGPFLVVDSSHKPVDAGSERDDRRRAAPNDPAVAQINGQRTAAAEPLVLGSGVMGALRARAVWLAALNVHPPENEADPVSLRLPDEAGMMGPVDRLFGVTGFRGLLNLEAIEVTGGKPWTVTSVKLDRFAGGPFDKALFATAAFVGVTLKLTLALVDRGETGEPGTKDRDLAKALIKAIQEDGLMLGHGTNKGFGWFECRDVEGVLSHV